MIVEELKTKDRLLDELLYSGECLIAALSVESALIREGANLAPPGSAQMTRWKACRTQGVACLERYERLLSRWRGAVQNAAGTACVS
jgi:hypothetical protein